MNKKSGSRVIKAKVKTARGRTISSTRWLERQLNDPYVISAKKEGYKSRAAYKLLEINDKYKVIRPSDIVLDLGAAPGGWSQVAVKYAKSPEKGKVIGIDLLPISPIPGAEFIQMDFSEEGAEEKLMELAGGKADLVLSDLAPNTTGQKSIDHLRIIALVEEAYYFAVKVLAPKGNFVAKILQGGTEKELLVDMKKNFEKVVHFKPESSRKDSSEMYVIALGFRGSDE